MVTLTQKERSLLEDEKKHEQLCIEKYTDYSNMAGDQRLKNLFQTLGQHEQQHLNSIDQILNGTVPNVSVQQGQQQQQQQSNTKATNANTQKDAFLCNDTLSMEKFISSTYNTSIFEFKDPNIRNVLNHIQKEEQQHGEQIYSYMSQNGMYN